MHSFRYVQGRLNCESVDLETLAQKHGTPLYVYSKETITDHFKRLDQGMAQVDHLVCYAVKANSNLAILHTIAQLGGGFDIVSGGELFRVLKAGGLAGKCTFAGVGKTRGEIEYALKQGIYSFNCESEAELRHINQIAGEMGKKAPVALRVNPNVDAKTHKYISTGKSENKFGVDFDRTLDAYAAVAKDCANLEIRGLQMHIGSQLTSIAPFLEAAKKVTPLVEALKERHQIKFFSIGGGIGIIYQDSLGSGTESWWGDKPDAERPLTIAEYANAMVPILEPLKLRILLEPGRMMVGNAGALLTKVLYLKQGNAKKFVIVDAGMNDLIRPALYEGWHQITPLQKGASETLEKVDVVGPICESGDFLAQDREIPAVQAGDTLAVLSAGAYGFTMASNYNSRPLAAEILVDGQTATVVRERQTLDDHFAVSIWREKNSWYSLTPMNRFSPFKNAITMLALMLACGLSFAQKANAEQREYVLLSGGPALRQWENLRREGEQHDRWWGNFIRPARMRIEEIQKQDPNAMITWLVYRGSYVRRSPEDKRSLTDLVASVRDKFHIKLVWFDNGSEVIGYLEEGQPRSQVKVCDFEYFGHSNKFCFMFDYSSEVYGASKANLHEKDLPSISGSDFTRDAFCKSWGCHTGESMSKAWRKATGVPMWVLYGKTDYSNPLKVELSWGGHWTKG